MFGLLGGLLGGAMRGGMARGGALGGLMNRRSSGGGQSQMPTYAAQASKSAPDAPEPQEPSGQTKPDTQQAQPPQQPVQQTMVQEAAPEIAKGQPAMQQQAQSPIKGLLDEANPAAEPPKPDTDRPPEPPSIVNRTDTATPVANPVSGVLGQTPQLEQTYTLANRIFDSCGNRQRMEFQEGMPAKHLDTSDSEWTPPMGLSYQQPTTVAGSVPARRYRT